MNPLKLISNDLIIKNCEAKALKQHTIKPLEVELLVVQERREVFKW
jgi:hypothetical protein